MQFRARYFNWASPGKGLVHHAHEWTIKVSDDASGRELVRAAMRAAGWPEVPYKIESVRRLNSLEVAITVEERPRQMITLWIEEQCSRFEEKGFEYITPIGSRIAAAAWNRVVAFGIFLVCLVGLMVTAIGQFYWVFREPERTRGIAVRVDQATNGALHGNPQETISSRANRARIKKRRWGCVLCRVLDLFKRGHCEDAAGK